MAQVCAQAGWLGLGQPLEIQPHCAVNRTWLDYIEAGRIAINPNKMPHISKRQKLLNALSQAKRQLGVQVYLEILINADMMNLPLLLFWIQIAALPQSSPTLITTLSTTLSLIPALSPNPSPISTPIPTLLPLTPIPTLTQVLALPLLFLDILYPMSHTRIPFFLTSTTSL